VWRAKSVLIGPVFKDGKVVGVIEMINKKKLTECVLDEHNRCIAENAEGSRGQMNADTPFPVRRMRSVSQQYEAFSKNDERLMQMLCTHCSIFLEQMDESKMKIGDLVPKMEE